MKGLWSVDIGYRLVAEELPSVLTTHFYHPGNTLALLGLIYPHSGTDHHALLLSLRIPRV